MRHTSPRGGGRRWIWPAVLLWALAAAPPAGWAALCGDDVDGQDVPCACGDVLVSSVVLGDDPIVTGEPCSADGLLVRNPDSPRQLVIDLRGHRLRGTGAGAGLRVLAGGPGGALVISSGAPAVITGFTDGIVARGLDALALVEDVIIEGMGRDGIRVSGPEFRIRRVEVYRAARDGFALGGRGFEITETRAVGSGRFGYTVMGHAGRIGRPGGGNLAERSGAAGFNVMGAGHVIADCGARYGRRSGVHVQAAQLDIRGCQAADNEGDGIDGLGTAWRLSGNEAVRNGGDGLRVRGVGLIDEGGNRGRDNAGSSVANDAVQCAIGGIPCAL